MRLHGPHSFDSYGIGSATRGGIMNLSYSAVILDLSAVQEGVVPLHSRSKKDRRALSQILSEITVSSELGQTAVYEVTLPVIASLFADPLPSQCFSPSHRYHPAVLPSPAAELQKDYHWRSARPS